MDLRNSLLSAALIVVLAPVAAMGGRPHDFKGLGFPSGYSVGYAAGVSGDGFTVVGTLYSDDTRTAEPWRWTAADGWQPLRDPTGTIPRGWASATSCDGSVIAGSVRTPQGTQAYCWTAGAGMELLAFPDGSLDSSRAAAVSADGSVVVGTRGIDTANYHEAFLWSRTGGMETLGDLAGGYHWTQPCNITADGSTVVGFSMTDSGAEAFRWTEAGGLEGLGSLPGPGLQSLAGGVSRNGNVVLGCSDSADGWQVFRWTADDGLRALGAVGPTTIWAEVADMSVQRPVAVGYGESDNGDEAFIWNPAHGVCNLQEYLVEEMGLDLAGWQLLQARGISDDGHTVVGWGHSPNANFEVWMAHIPEPATLAMLALGGVGLLVRRRR